MARGIRRGMILKCLREIAVRDDAIHYGIIQVPPRGERDGLPPYCALEGFELDLDKLSIGLPAALVARREAERRRES